MEIWGVLSDILILLFAALVLGSLCEKFRQSSILGYLVAGTLLGPNALQVVSSADAVSILPNWVWRFYCLRLDSSSPGID